ncbi:hypothetical protein [Pedobacter frigoris]|uniref:hypothetical protein n=1 Tax=Pedobacter frigoris TaxID=2571272 RepID=UPI0029309D44|nr:hypothetical protein [Pedobacter frigoris]
MINEIITRITNLIPIERIYLSTFEYQNTKVKELSILMRNTSKLHIIEAKPLVEMIMNGYPEYKSRMFYTQEVYQAIAQGSMVFYSICREENLVYLSPDSTDVISVVALSANEVLCNANVSLQKEVKKIGGFREGAAFYIEQNNQLLAAFMLHQVIELSFRTAELLVIGKEKVSHSIRNHQKLMKHYVAEMGSVFNDQDDQEMILLALLDDAYRCVRYENDYEVSREELLFFVQKADLIGERLIDLYEIVIAQFEQNFIGNNECL